MDDKPDRLTGVPKILVWFGMAVVSWLILIVVVAITVLVVVGVWKVLTWTR